MRRRRKWSGRLMGQYEKFAIVCCDCLFCWGWRWRWPCGCVNGQCAGRGALLWSCGRALVAPVALSPFKLTKLTCGWDRGFIPLDLFMSLFSQSKEECSKWLERSDFPICNEDKTESSFHPWGKEVDDPSFLDSSSICYGFLKVDL